MKISIQTIASTLTMVLLPLHVAGDVVRGFDKGGSGLLIVVAILVVLSIGTFLLADRIPGHIIQLLGGLGALAMPIIHRNNGFTPAVAQSPGGVLFMWTLMALGVTGALGMMLSVRGLWQLRAKPNGAQLR